MKVSKQVILMRTDLRNTKGEKIHKGKMIAQGAHASMAAVVNQMITSDMPYRNGRVDKVLMLNKGTAIKDWLEGRFTKVCLAVNSEKELVELYNKAKAKGLISAIITDAGLTEFGGTPTITCCAIGPAWSDEIDEITGHLSLM